MMNFKVKAPLNVTISKDIKRVSKFEPSPEGAFGSSGAAPRNREVI